MAQKHRLTSSHSVITTSRKLLAIVWREDRALFMGNIVVILVPGIIPFVNAYIYAQIINFVIHASAAKHVAETHTHLYLLIALRIGILFLQDLAFTAQRRYNVILTTKIPLVFTQLIMAQLSNLDVELLEDSAFQEKFQNAKENAGWRTTNMLNDIFYALQSLLQLIIAAGSLLFLNWIFAVIIALTALPTFVYQARSAKQVWSIWASNSSQRKRYSYLYYSLQHSASLKELKLFQLNRHFITEVAAISKKFATENIAQLNRNFWFGALANTANIIGYAAVEVYIILQTLGRRLSVGSLTYYTTDLINFQNGINGLFRTASSLLDESQYVAEIFEVLSIRPKIISPPAATKLTGSAPPMIEFRHVNYAYPGTDIKILNDFSLTIRPGEKVAFVGENGAGKTTIIKLLCRFYDVDDGEILINGCNLKQLDLINWYEHIGVLFQDFLRYEYNLRDNIRFGRITKPEAIKDIMAAARQAGADDVQAALPKGYDQMLGRTFEGGIELSGGQWQKVALARGFYRDAPVLILDEPTSAIDARAEHQIFKRVEKLAVNRTVLIISHRFSTVRNADTIYVIKQGSVTESGTHSELMQRHGMYAELFNLQAEAYRS